MNENSLKINFGIIAEFQENIDNSLEYLFNIEGIFFLGLKIEPEDQNHKLIDMPIIIGNWKCIAILFIHIRLTYFCIFFGTNFNNIFENIVEEVLD